MESSTPRNTTNQVNFDEEHIHSKLKPNRKISNLQLSQDKEDLEASSKTIDFSKRQDVLGKTIVRALKRYYLELFNKSNDFKSYG